MRLQEAAVKRLRELRQKARKSRDKPEPTYHVDDYVLVDRRRWPQRKLKKTESQWFGPFRVTQVRHNAAMVAASPNLGGEVLVTFDHLKHWNSLLDYDDSDDNRG